MRRGFDKLSPNGSRCVARRGRHNPFALSLSKGCHDDSLLVRDVSS